MALYEGGWARGTTGQDAGRIFRLVAPRGDAWLCQVVDTESGESRYRTEVRVDGLESIDAEREPLLFLSLEAIAGPYPY